ncbi:bifunctional [glutamate--ammonia ligase]-adenylyl-L-tyrosine phosphorylase/[glutamate--ammonia-ligase] adenylyltransferase [Thiolapillus brandeum]|uniref:Bifunctional glutamine synthetase adenylyltransferase/adenylyl-removing enzyme n=1 Tax=Thiolapillus brandeum TaxID=1076588 RepID=A0A7U6GL86_9GAMM|nr:bifunctional [glutamate--ammonia ligase]-adenylyl-L-tyrosine phosphorylase/[glutamate--ammonia-ligase] adenylyltransferase [Thiolapillus brandeum]BAO45706.1 glutamate-ammonia-ligase adenylyltransferase [Thiolapillus brandeum]
MTDRLQALLSRWFELPQAQALPDEAMHRELKQVWQASDFVAQLCLRQPDWLLELADSGLLERALAPEELAGQLRDILEGVTEEAALLQRLRQFRQRQMLRIIWRDISRKAPLEETLEDLSELADQCIRQALDYLTIWANSRYGTPRNAEGEPQRLVVLGMGKLGARELNLSSDIDLIFTFPAHGQTDGRRPLSNEQFFSRLGRSLIKALGAQTEDGFVFRVDMRLRPFGEAGPLALSFGAMETYYSSQAREWERYAMIKARPITGESVYQDQLLGILRPFVYRRYIDFGAIDAIRDMKRRIQAEMHKRGMDANIKLGQGGIREIEFIGQAFQLVHGGRDRDLQLRPILKVLGLLQKKGLMGEREVRELTRAYTFLRLAENRLQAWRDEQTHLLPEDDAGRQRLAQSMYFDDWEGFHSVLEEHRRRVEEYFRQVFADTETQCHPLEKAWLAEDEAEAARLLEGIGYEQAEKVLEQLQDFRSSHACRVLSEAARHKLDRLMPMLMEHISRVTNPDLTLVRLLELLQAIVQRTAYMDLLLENPQVLEQLVRLGSESRWVVSQLVRYPVLLDELLDPRRLYAPLRREELKQELQTLLGRIDPDDLEQQMERLRQFAAGNRLRTAAADITGAIELMVVSDYLTEIAEVVLEQVLELAWNYLVQRHGRPGGVSGRGFSVLGYGKLGGVELGYGSDLDLVFLHGDYPGNAVTDGRKSVPNDVFYARLGQRMVHLINTRTPSGVLYEVDMRLRPNGNSGLLVASLSGFEKYQLNTAWTWEHQALVRARPVAGEARLGAQIETVRERVLRLPRDAEKLRQEVAAMREKMRTSLDRSREGVFDLKQGKGGITDIEFMVQYAVLKWAGKYPALTAWTDNTRLLETLVETGVMDPSVGEALVLAYQRFRDTYHHLALQEQPGQIEDGRMDAERQQVMAAWEQFFGA